MTVRLNNYPEGGHDSDWGTSGEERKRESGEERESIIMCGGAGAVHAVSMRCLADTNTRGFPGRPREELACCKRRPDSRRRQEA